MSGRSEAGQHDGQAGQGTEARHARALRLWVGAVVLAMLAMSPLVQSHARAATLLMRFAAGPKVPATGVATFGRYEVDEAVDVLPEGGPKIRIYTPRGVTDPPGMVLVHGIHCLGVDEPRLIGFSKAIASAGIMVLTPHVRELADYRVAQSSIATIGASAKEVARRTGRQAVGVMGMSFGGGLAVMSATDPMWKRYVSFAVSVGGHHDLGRVLTFLGENRIASPSGVVERRAHDYGMLVFYYSHVAELFAAGDVEVARDVLHTWLCGVAPALGTGREDLAKEKAARLSEPSRAKMNLLFAKSAAQLAPDLVALVKRHEASMREVSPSARMNDVLVPLFLLHGATDDVIPASEALWIAHDLNPSVARHVLVSPALRHVDLLGEPSPRQGADLVHFMAGILRSAWQEPR